MKGTSAMKSSCPRVLWVYVYSPKGKPVRVEESSAKSATGHTETVKSAVRRKPRSSVPAMRNAARNPNTYGRRISVPTTRSTAAINTRSSWDNRLRGGRDDRSGLAGRARAPAGRERAAQGSERARRDAEGQHEGGRLRLRARPVPRDALQGAVDEAPRHGRRHPQLHPRQRDDAQGEGAPRRRRVGRPGKAQTRATICDRDRARYSHRPGAVVATRAAGGRRPLGRRARGRHDHHLRVPPALPSSGPRERRARAEG